MSSLTMIVDVVGLFPNTISGQLAPGGGVARCVVAKPCPSNIASCSGPPDEQRTATQEPIDLTLRLVEQRMSATVVDRTHPGTASQVLCAQMTGQHVDARLDRGPGSCRVWALW